MKLPYPSSEAMKCMILLSVALGSMQAPAQSDLAKAAYAKLHDAKSLTATMEVTFPGGKPQTWKVELLKPNLYAILSDDQQFHFDGKTESQYWPLTHRYETATPSQVNGAPFAVGLNMFFAGASMPFGTSRDATVTLNGKKVIGLQLSGERQTLYLDPATGLPLGYDEQLSGAQVLKVRYSHIAVNGPVNTRDLAWNPPTESKPLEAPVVDSKLLPSGAAAPTPVLKALDGTPFDLSKSFASHKATLLYFWDGPPQGADLTFIKDAKAQAGDQSLLILAIEMRNTPEVAKTLNVLPCPVFIDTDGAMANGYGVTGPTEYLIGTDGKVAAHFVGFDPGAIVKILRQRGFKI
jgi:outer membrane lipoprotein-sorting protein